MKRLFAFALATSVLLALVGCGGAGGAASPSAAVKIMFDGMKAGNVEMMKSVMPKAMLETEEAKKGPTDEEVNAMKAMFASVTYEIGEEKIADDGNTAQVQVKMKMMGMDTEVTYHCIKEDGAWKVDMSQGGMGEPSMQ